MEERERESVRQKGSVRQGVRRDQASREQSFVEGGLKITSSFVKQSEKEERCCVQKLPAVLYCCMNQRQQE